jgi:hypothetical protein
MINFTSLVGVISLFCFCCAAQTNDCAPSSIRFFLPPAQLRLEPAPQPDQRKTTLSLTPPATVSVAQDALQDLISDGDFHSRVIRSGEFYLTRSAVRPDTGIARFLDQVFTPEVIPWGKASLSCPFLTAIKRKNPLSLLSGLTAQTAPTGDGEIVFRLIELNW